MAAAAPAAVLAGGAQPAALQMHNQVVLNHPIVTKDKEDLEILTALAQNTYGAKAKRVSLFFKDNPEVWMRFKVHTLATGLFGAGAGVITGLAFSGGNPVVGYKAGAVGFALGLAGGVASQYHRIRQDRLYDIWRGEAISVKVYDIMRKYINIDLEGRMCPINFELIKVPYQDCCPNAAHTFEAEAILRHIQMSGNESAPCPISRLPIKASDLHFDMEYHPEVLRLLRPAFVAASNNPQTVQQVVAAAQAVVANYREDVMAQRLDMAEQDFKETFKSAMGGKISSKEAGHKAEAIIDKYKIKED